MKSHLKHGFEIKTFPWGVLLSGALFFAPRQPAQAAFEEDFGGARSASLGRADAASARGTANLFTHPAALAGVAGPEASLAYSRLYTGIPGVNWSLGSAAFGLRTGLGNFGFGVGTFKAAGLEDERTAAAGWARPFLGRWEAGVTGKQLVRRFETGGDPLAAQDAVFAGGNSRTAYALDAGVRCAPASFLTISAAFHNINRPDIGLSSQDRLPRRTEAGLSLRWNGLEAAGGLQYISSDDRRSARAAPALGLEKGWKNFAVRAGFNDAEWASGAGVSLGGLTMDYAFLASRSLGAGDGVSHRMQMTYKFRGGDGKP